MKMLNVQSTLFGAKSSSGDYEGKAFSSTTFYLPADMAQSASSKAIGMVTVPYKCGDHTEIQKWLHLEKSWPVGGVPVLCDFEVVQGRDAQGRDSGKLQLLAIRPVAVDKKAA